jgi:anhydro-N-acetylmuramic acid kinase
LLHHKEGGGDVTEAFEESGWYSPLSRKWEKIGIGLMSGTSLDGIDAAVVSLRGYGVHTEVNQLGYACFPYEESFRERLRRLCLPEEARVDEWCEVHTLLGRMLADAARQAARKANVDWSSVDFISSHGQTLYHMPHKGATLQIGELAVLAQHAQKVTVGDFRPHDLAAGGEGAPLVPYVDNLLFGSEHFGQIILNIGGIANITALSPGNSIGRKKVAAFDCGPGNMLLDAFVSFQTAGKEKFDRDGQYAAHGTAHKGWLEELLQHPFYRQSFPKSTGREMFGERYARELWHEADRRGISFVDRMATLTELTVQSIVAAIHQGAEETDHVRELIIGGGGYHNTHLVNRLRLSLPHLRIVEMESYGFSADAREAVTFAVLGNECLHRSPNQLPSATGAKRRVVMGKVVLPT